MWEREAPVVTGVSPVPALIRPCTCQLLGDAADTAAATEEWAEGSWLVNFLFDHQVRARAVCRGMLLGVLPALLRKRRSQRSSCAGR